MIPSKQTIGPWLIHVRVWVALSLKAPIENSGERREQVMIPFENMKPNQLVVGIE